MVSNRTQHPPPTLSHTLSVCTVLWYREGRGGGESWTREKVREFTKLGRKYQHDWMYLRSINLLFPISCWLFVLCCPVCIQLPNHTMLPVSYIAWSTCLFFYLPLHLPLLHWLPCLSAELRRACSATECQGYSMHGFSSPWASPAPFFLPPFPTGNNDICIIMYLYIQTTHTPASDLSLPSPLRWVSQLHQLSQSGQLRRLYWAAVYSSFNL